jgi:flagellar hook-associated protein 2
MTTITTLGIGSGLDLESIVEAYINAEAIPQEIRLQEKEERLSLELSGVGSFKSAMSSFNDVLEKLTDSDAFNKQVATSSSSAVDVVSNGFASNGNFSIDVQQLAQGSRIQSTSFTSSSDTVGTGTLTLTAGTNSFNVDIDAADNLSAIRDKINAESDNFGVTANIINSDSGSYLVYTSTITGDTNNLSVTTSDASLDAISTNNTQDANDVAKSSQVLVNNNLITSDTNTLQNVIEDLTLTLNEETVVGSPITISVAQDQDNGSDLINEFINGYNTLVSNLDALGDSENGVLAFDPNVRQVKRQLTDIAIQAANGLTGSLSSLNDIGLEINRDGFMAISTFSSENILSGQDRLDNALETNLIDIGELFASSTGIASQMTEIIDGYIASDGVLTERVDTLTERVNDIEYEWEDLETRLRSYEDLLRQQFTFLDSTVSQYSATADWLASTLVSVTGDDG